MYDEYSTYLLIKHYLAETKNSEKAKELEELIKDDLGLPEDKDLEEPEFRELLVRKYKTENEKINKFINISAWVFIVLTGLYLSSFIGPGLFNFSAPKIGPNIQDFYTGELHPIYKFWIENPTLFYFINLVSVSAMFASSIGILMRSNFARKVAIILLGFKIFMNFIEPLLIKFVFPSAHNLTHSIPGLNADSVHQSSIIFSLIINVIFICIYGWLIVKYTNLEIVEEFK